jgi:hypothetical protein
MLLLNPLHINFYCIGVHICFPSKKILNGDFALFNPVNILITSENIRVLNIIWKSDLWNKDEIHPCLMHRG